MRIQTLAAAAVLSLAATIPLSTAAFADPSPGCLELKDMDAKVNSSHCLPDVGHPIDPPKPDDHQKRRGHLCDGLVHDIVQDSKPDKLRDEVHDRLKDRKPCHDDESDHKRRSHDDPDEKSSHHKKSDDNDSDDGDSSDSDSSDSDSNDSDSNDKSDNSATDDSEGDDDTTTTQVKVVPKGSVDTGDGSSR